MHRTMVSSVALAAALLSAPVIRADGFHSVHSSNGTDVWAVGNGGAVFRSFDGGTTWGRYDLDTVTLRSVVSAGQTLWMAGDGGILHRSTDGGITWSTSVQNGSQTIRALAFPTPLRGWGAGDGGTIIRTTDAGATWTPQTSGASSPLYALWFADSLTGFAAGAEGTLRKTTDAGANWNPAGEAWWTSDLFSLGGRGSTVFVVGARGFGRKSSDTGEGWQALRLGTDSRTDVTGVFAVTADSAVFTGAGGAIRTTADGGSSFAWGIHGMHAGLSAVFMADPLRGWACSDRNNAVLRTTDGGATWQLPAGTTLSLSWSRRLPENSSIGNTFVIDSWNSDRILVALGDSIYRSTDRGETWSFRTRIAGGGATHSFFVSPKDSNLLIVANTGGGDAVKRSTNGGLTWTTTIQRGFTSYGMPLEMDPDRPDTVLFAPDGTGSGGSDANGILYRSTNFGLTWDTLAQTNFRSPCDIVIVPDSGALVYVGDGITGSGRGKMWRSEDEGKAWTRIDSVTGSEIPTVAVSRLRNAEGFHTSWGSGGVRKTGDHGLSWTQVTSTGSAWGIDVAKDDPHVVVFGVYGGGISYVSTDGGVTFPSGLQASLTGSNYAILAYDRSTILAQQSGGVYKLRFTYSVPVTNTQTLSLLSPNGGENWQYNTVHAITWASGNLPGVRIEYQTSPAGAWQTITPGVPASAGSYDWTIPDAATVQARIRISDPADESPIDSSAGTFTISVAAISSVPPAIVFDTIDVGAHARDTLRIFNAGTAPLVIGAVTNTTPHFMPGRTSFTIPPGASDTLSVHFVPEAGGLLLDTLVLLNSSPVGLYRVALAGTGRYAVPVQIAPAEDELFVPLSAPFSWNAVAGAQRYHLQVAVDPGFAAPDIDDSSITSTGAVASLAEGQGYFWRVRGLYPGGGTPWTSVRSFTTAAAVSTRQSVTAGWNLISVPLRAPDPRTTALYPSAASGAFAYEPGTGYALRDSMFVGEGYWLKFGAPESVSVAGDQAGRDTLWLSAGWNLIGAASAAVDTAAVIRIPADLLTSPFFGYAGAYQAAPALNPGRAYWVKAREAGMLIVVPIGPAAGRSNTPFPLQEQSKR